jgi:hypothetical protein
MNRSNKKKIKTLLSNVVEKLIEDAKLDNIDVVNMVKILDIVNYFRMIQTELEKDIDLFVYADEMKSELKLIPNAKNIIKYLMNKKILLFYKEDGGLDFGNEYYKQRRYDFLVDIEIDVKKHKLKYKRNYFNKDDELKEKLEIQEKLNNPIYKKEYYETSNPYKLHRTYWYNKEDQLHNEEGPAIEWVNGYVEYRLYDKRYSKENWENEVIKIKLDRLKKLK